MPSTIFKAISVSISLAANAAKKPCFADCLTQDGGSFMFRTMWETNFLTSNSIRERPRQMIRFTHPFEAEPRRTAVLWDELFVRATTTPVGGKAGFGQNRAFGGLGWTLNPGFRTEPGYMNQYIENAGRGAATMRHPIMNSLFRNF